MHFDAIPGADATAEMTACLLLPTRWLISALFQVQPKLYRGPSCGQWWKTPTAALILMTEDLREHKTNSSSTKPARQPLRTHRHRFVKPNLILHEGGHTHVCNR